jgi:site-specific DNA-methyltransferase (adenine-specific)
MKILTGNSRDKLKELEDNSIDSLVTDPPYLINFMGKDWDKENSPAGDATFWEEVLRVMKPGAHGLVFGHSRQHHRVMIALEDAGFEIRDCLMWMYGSGFPKSHNIGKAVDKLQGNNDWEGWGTALKPAYEPIILVRKPLEKKLTIAKNVLKHGVGGINIDASRIGTQEDFSNVKPRAIQKLNSLNNEANEHWQAAKDKLQNLGRFPANVLLSHHEDCKVVGEVEDTRSGGNTTKEGWFSGTEAGAMKATITTPVYECADGCAVKILDEQAPKTGNAFKKTRTKDTTGGSGDSWTNGGKKAGQDNGVFDGLSGASRFFYCAKVGKKERNAGLDNFEEKEVCYGYKTDSESVKNRDKKGDIGLNKVKIRKNTHPTVKPIKLMTYLTKLITPPNGKVLDPFMGSGSTGMACVMEGFDFVGIDMDEEYVEISKARIEWARTQNK